MSELKNCPFCRGDCEMQYPQVTKNYKTETCYSAGCPDCGIWTDYCDTEEEAIAAWNRRAEGWISVSERLPDKLHDVLVYSSSCHEIFKAFSNDMEIWCFSYDNRPIMERITHWMPLPSPPEGE